MRKALLLIALFKFVDFNTLGATPIEKYDMHSKPETFHLAQNHPNPFNPQTMIQFTLLSEQFVTLTVYDMRGREIETLLNGQQAAGRHTVTFDASQRASGLYLYSLKTATQLQTKKMMLIK